MTSLINAKHLRPASGPRGLVPRRPTRRLVIVVRADPVICGHSVEARNLAETALLRGYDDVRIVSWPVDRLRETGLPLKPLDSISPYSPGITVERPAPVGDYKVPDGRYHAGIVGRLVELFTDGVPTVAMALYLSPHAFAIAEARRIAESTGLPCRVTTIAEAVGSDVTNIVRSCVAEGRLGPAAAVLSTFLSFDVCVAVSDYTKEVVVAAAAEVDTRLGTRFAAECAERVAISYPAMDTRAYLDLDPAEVDARLAARGLRRGEYVLFLSRLTTAKGVDDLIEGYAASRTRERMPLVIAGNGPEAHYLHAVAAESGAGDSIVFAHDVDDAEKPFLMAGSAAYVLPSKPCPDFTETFGIALAEKMLAGGGPVITTRTGGIGEAVGDCALTIGVHDPVGIRDSLDRAVLDTPPDQLQAWELRARTHALQFDRAQVFDRLFARLEEQEPVAEALG
ncbi:glycosyltransferase [Microlunatus kandeliicorticis]|nr:glycosyltransferase [Microlunatus kandeliicorticis]